jgi:putative redox protein
MSEPVREYKSFEITVVWDASKCTHSGRCVRQLPEVFNLKTRPWITIDGATADRIESQIANCPSGALTCYRPNP